MATNDQFRRWYFAPITHDGDYAIEAAVPGDDEGEIIGQFAHESDARLASAAPDLLAACKATVAGWDSIPDANCPDYVVLTRAAIARAEAPDRTRGPGAVRGTNLET